MNIVSVDNKIFTIRGIQVMIDRDLAELYEVETKVLNQAVKRNIERFPSDFIFQLSDSEKNGLVTNCDRFERLKHSTSNPYAFTEQGVYMLATVLKSKVATDVTLSIMRTFTKMREFAINYSDIIDRLERIEKTIKIDQQQINYNTHKIDEAFELLNEILKETKNTDKNLIGFRPKIENKKD